MRVMLCRLVAALCVVACVGGAPPGDPDAGAPDAHVDRDDDGVADDVDNCPDMPNLPQTDADDDGIGDACTCGDVVIASEIDLAANHHCVSMASLMIQGDEVTSTASLDRLTQVTGWLTVSAADTLGTLQLPSVERVASLRITGNDLLTSFIGLEDVRVGDLEVRGNEALTSLDGIGVADAMVWLTIEENPALQSISALTGTEEVSYLAITDCPALVGLDGLEHLERSISFYLARLPTSSLAPLAALRQSRHLGLVDLTELTSLDGLQGLETLTGDLTLWRANQLTSLDALTSLTSVTLVDIDGNPLITQCEVEAFAASLAAPCDCTGNAACD